jgi:hypothetical protein
MYQMGVRMYRPPLRGYGLPNLSAISRILVLGLYILTQPASWRLVARIEEGEKTKTSICHGPLSNLSGTYGGKIAPDSSSGVTDAASTKVAARSFPRP